MNTRRDILKLFGLGPFVLKKKTEDILRVNDEPKPEKPVFRNLNPGGTGVYATHATSVMSWTWGGPK
jgi:hypothetical protein